MIKVLYIVSTLKRSGPTKQLLYILKDMDYNCFEVKILTLSPEVSDTLEGEFINLGVKVDSLKLNRFNGVYKSKYLIKKYINSYLPDVIHSQGIRTDSILARLPFKRKWISTIRNYPPDDYSMKFGLIMGKIMSIQHFMALKKCEYLIACSKSISNQLAVNKIKSNAIQNGVIIKQNSIREQLLTDIERPIFISVGNLIPRKNMLTIINAFNDFKKSSENLGSLIILGDGAGKQDLLNQSCQSIYYYGNVPNVKEYLQSADVFVSASFSEGLPNTVLEALSVGMDCILSDIPSHNELSDEFNDFCTLYGKPEDKIGLYNSFQTKLNLFVNNNLNKNLNVNMFDFASNAMSVKYQNLYKKISFGENNG